MQGEGPTDRETPRQREGGRRESDREDTRWRERQRQGKQETEKARAETWERQAAGTRTQETGRGRDGQRRAKETERERSEQIAQSVASRRKVQTWGGGRDSGLGGRWRPPSLPHPSLPHAARPPTPPRRPPHLRHKGGAARRMVAAGAWAGARWKPQGSSRGGSGQGCRGG